MLASASYADSESPSSGSWSAPQPLLPVAEGAFESRLAVTESGEAVAGWLGGSPPRVVHGSRSARAARRAGWTGESVVVDRGTLAGGFEPPTVLEANTWAALSVAVSGSGVVYAAWSQLNDGAMMLATAAPGQPFSVQRLPIPRRSNLLGLLQSPADPVAVVWLTYRKTAALPLPILNYALLRADGTLGRVVTVGLMSPVAEGIPFALNDHGAFAAVGFTPEERGSPSPRPLIAVCDAAGRCTPPTRLNLGRTGVRSYGEYAVALSDDGTVSVLAGFNQGSTPHGLFSAVRRPGRRWIAAGLSDGGNFPVAAAHGPEGAVGVFQDELGGVLGALDCSLLPAAGARFAEPTVIAGSTSPYRPVLAGASNGNFVIAWFSPATSPLLANSQLIAAVGSAAQLGRAQIAAPADVAADTIEAGIDGAGDAIVMWSDWIENGPKGVFVANYQPG
jgi:hypothetical protein